MVIFTGSATFITFLCPTAARVSPYFLAACMITLGLTRSTGQVIMGDMMAWWCPVSERVLLNSFIISGFNIAGIFANTIAGFACSIPLDNGWPFIFYIVGGILVVYIVLWCVLSSGTPDGHPFISEKERQYIIAQRFGMDKSNTKKSPRPPYREIFRSKPVYGYLIVCGTFLWVMTATFAYLPIFYRRTLGFSTAETGSLMTAIALCRWVSTYMWVAYSRFLASTNRFTTKTIRKISLVSGSVVSGLLQFAAAAVVPTASGWVIFGLLVAGNMFHCVGQTIFGVVALDMAPRYAGFLTAIQGTVSSIVAMTGPLIMGLITPDNTREQWQTAMVVFGVVILLGTAAFCVLGEAALQPWAQPHKTESSGSSPAHIGPQVEGDDGRERRSIQVNGGSKTSSGVKSSNGGVVKGEDNLAFDDLEITVTIANNTNEDDKSGKEINSVLYCSKL